MTNHVYSTMSADVTYHAYVNVAGQASSRKSVLINGGSAVANKQLYTPMGVRTEVSDEDLELLKADKVFLAHMNNGFIKIDTKKIDPEKAVASGMEVRDKSAPKTPEDFDESVQAESKSFGGKKGTNKPLE
jgi:hypothetical protein